MLAYAFSPKFLVLYTIIGSSIYIHFRGRMRFKFTRQLTDHSTFLAPINALVYLFSAVSNEPVLDVKDLPELEKLREEAATFRDDATRLYDEKYIRRSNRLDDLGFNSFFKSGWKRFYLKWYDDFLPSATKLCPKSVDILRKVPSVNAAMFALLPPGSRLVRHRDPYAGSLRYHLGLITPNSEKCCIYIDGEPYQWRDGEGVLFDATYMHYAENQTDQQRIILFCDVARPMQNRLAALFCRLFGRFVVSATATRNLDTDRVGLFNKLFHYVYQIRKVGIWMKRKNQRGYYLFKYTLMAALFYLIFL